MPVYFVYRSFDHGPTGKHLKRFEDDTILDWFRHYWDHLAVEDEQLSDARLANLLGCDGWFLCNPFSTASREGLPAPPDGEALLELLHRSVGEESVIGSSHCLQVFTETDGEGGALYSFDDYFLREHGSLASYLLHEDWRLPSGRGDGPFVPSVETMVLQPGGTGPGTVYVALLERESKYPLDDLPVGYRIEGIRLPGLAQHLFHMPSEMNDADWPGQLRTLPALLIAGVEPADPMESAFLQAVQSAPRDAVNWAGWSDWRQEQGGEPPGLTLLRGAFERLARYPGNLHEDLPQEDDLANACRKLLALETEQKDELRTNPQSLIHVEDHLAQACLDGSWTDEPYFHQWIFFDDLWASAYPELANAILRFARRWDVLSADEGK